jgi:hypothetical protein
MWYLTWFDRVKILFYATEQMFCFKCCQLTNLEHFCAACLVCKAAVHCFKTDVLDKSWCCVVKYEHNGEVFVSFALEQLWNIHCLDLHCLLKVYTLKACSSDWPYCKWWAFGRWELMEVLVLEDMALTEFGALVSLFSVSFWSQKDTHSMMCYLTTGTKATEQLTMDWNVWTIFPCKLIVLGIGYSNKNSDWHKTAYEGLKRVGWKIFCNEDSHKLSSEMTKASPGKGKRIFPISSLHLGV